MEGTIRLVSAVINHSSEERMLQLLFWWERPAGEEMRGGPDEGSGPHHASASTYRSYRICSTGCVNFIKLGKLLYANDGLFITENYA